MVNYDRKLKRPNYKLAKVLEVHPDGHGVVRTVTVGFRRSDAREKSLPYVCKQLEKMKIGVQRLAVVCPIEEQSSEDVGSQSADHLGNDDAMVTGIENDVDVGNDDEMKNDDG